MAQKITKNQLKRLINEVIGDDSLAYTKGQPPISEKNNLKLFQVLKDIITDTYNGPEPLSKEEFMDILMEAGNLTYNQVQRMKKW